MIDKLTDAQVAAMPLYVEKWLKVGFDCSPINQEAAEKAVHGMYANVDLAAPKVFFTDGPLDGFNLYKKLGGSNYSNFISGVMFGQHAAPWLSFYNFFKEEVGVKDIEKIDPLIEVANQCGWVYCARETAIVMAKPEYIRMDEDDRLHCETGPAIRYPDGFTVYSWHGVRIPGEWIENRKALTAQKALSVENMEQRRAACEIVGWVNIIKQLDGKVVDEDEDPMIGTLVRVNIPDLGEEQFLRVLCGTGREFAIPVPPDMKSALEANAWTFNIEPDVLRMLEVRT